MLHGRAALFCAVSIEAHALRAGHCLVEAGMRPCRGIGVLEQEKSSGERKKQIHKGESVIAQSQSSCSPKQWRALALKRASR